jgi:hypothetical protein
MEVTYHPTNADPASVTDRTLYKAGGAAALIAALLFRRNLDAEWMLLRGIGIVHSGPVTAPHTVADWFALLQDQRLLGLTLLNLFDLVNYALVGLIFLALFFALRRVSPAWMVIAAALSFAGIAIYLTSNQAFTLLTLSQQYAAATAEAERAMLRAGGQAVLAIHQNTSFANSGIYLSFLLVSVAGLIISLVMLKSSIFTIRTARMGILANGFGLGYYLGLAFAPALVFIPISISAIFLLIWYIQVGLRLWALGRTAGAVRDDVYSEPVVSHQDLMPQP